MFYYLLNNSTMILKEKKEIKNIKILIYGTLCYIMTHIVINSSFNSLMTYYWILLILDCIIMYLLSNIETNGKVIINKNTIESQILDENETQNIVPVNVKNYDSEVELNTLLGEL